MNSLRRLARRGIRLADRLVGPDDPKTSRPASEAFPGDGSGLVAGPTPRHDPTLDDDPRLVVLMPHLSLERMSGGPNTILQVTAPLLARGHRIRYVATMGRLEPDEAAIRSHIRQVTGTDANGTGVELVDASSPGSELRLGAADVPFATWWPTAHLARGALDVVRAREFLYLVQDFEPGFYPWSTRYALALATYAMPMRAVVNDALLLEHLRSERIGVFGAQDLDGRAVAFRPAVDRAVFVPRERSTDGPRRLVFYARPRNARNLFELGLSVLRKAVADGAFERGTWAFRAIGQAIPGQPLGAGRRLDAEPWMAYRDYAAYLGTSDVLLSLMLSPHPSYPPLEMAATGGLVVTNSFGVKTPEALAAISPGIRAAAPEVGALAEALGQAVADSDAGPARSAPFNLPGSWPEALTDVVPWLERAIADIRGS